MRRADPGRSIAACTRIIDTTARASDRAWRAPRFAYERKGDYDRAIADFTTVRLRRHYRRRHRQSRRRLVRRAISIAHLPTSIRVNPDRFFTYHARPSLLRKRVLDRAAADLAEAIRLNPKDAVAYADTAMIWTAKGDLDHAIDDLTRAIEIHPAPTLDVDFRHVNFYVSRGNIRLGKRDLDGAIADYGEAAKVDPRNPEAYANRGLAFVAKGDHARAIADFGEAIRLAPESKSAYYRRGHAWFDRYINAAGSPDRSDLDRAVADFTDVIRLDPADADAYYWRGLARYSGGDREQAIADLTEAVALRPRDDKLIEALRRFKPDAPAPEAMTTDGLKHFLETH